MGGSLLWVGDRAGEVGRGGQKRSSEADKRGVTLGCHCCCGRNSLPRTFSLCFARGDPKLRRRSLLYGSPSRVALGVRQRVDCRLLRKRLCAPRIHPVSSLYTSFSSRWDEFGQNRRGGESTAAPRRGPRVSFTKNSQRRPGNFRELEQRVFRHGAGRYTTRVLSATPFLLFGALTPCFTSPAAR